MSESTFHMIMMNVSQLQFEDIVKVGIIDSSNGGTEGWKYVFSDKFILGLISKSLIYYAAI